MPTPPLTEQDMRAAVEAFKANGFNKTLAAEALSLKQCRSSLHREGQ